MNMQRISLALVITELGVGGAERTLTNLAVLLNPARYAPVVYSLGARPAEAKSELVHRLDRARIPVRFLDAGGLRHFPRTWRRLRWLLQQQSPQIVQTFMFHANTIGVLAAARAHVPHVVWGIRVADPRRWRQRVERHLASRVDRITCVSQEVADFCRQQVGLPPDKLNVIGNGIDADTFASATPCDLQSLGVPPGRRVLLVLGRLDVQKGLDWLLRLSPRLLQALPEHDLLLVGDGPQRSLLEAEAERLDVAQRVHLAGWQPDVASILASSEILLLPSRWEGMPNVVLEAMASGRPVVATRVAGIGELLGSGADQQSVTLEAEQEFIDCVVALAADPERRRRIGLQNQARAQANFSLKNMAESYQNLYETLLKTGC